MPLFGLFLTKMLFALMNPDLDQMREDSNFWVMWMAIVACAALFTYTGQKACFGIIGENITLGMRKILYDSLIRKHMGFFDKRENSPGVLSSVLATEAQELNGASTGGTSVMVESMFGLVAGIVLAFYFSWRMALVALGVAPFMAVAGKPKAKPTCRK